MGAERIGRIPSPSFPGISDSVRVSAGDLLFVSGAVGFEEDGSVPVDFARAVELTLRELQRALNAGGAEFADVVRINIYITQLDDERLRVFREVRDRVMDVENPPASSLIGVQSLVKGATVEIDAIAAL
jgi:enamine deaminase RidA (YjgF/YER057c/UK114 family)